MINDIIVMLLLEFAFDHVCTFNIYLVFGIEFSNSVIYQLFTLIARIKYVLFFIFVCGLTLKLKDAAYKCPGKNYSSDFRAISLIGRGSTWGTFHLCK